MMLSANDRLVVINHEWFASPLLVTTAIIARRVYILIIDTLTKNRVSFVSHLCETTSMQNRMFYHRRPAINPI